MNLHEVSKMSWNLSSIYPEFNVNMDKLSNKKVYEFDDFRLDGSHLMLYRHGVEVSLAPKAIETLLVLVERRGGIVSKDELMSAIWTDSVVEESNLTQYLYLLRKTLGETSDGRPFIETLRRRGYRFNGQVTESQAIHRTDGGTSDAGVPQSVKREGNVLRVVDWNHAERDADDASKRPVSQPSRSASVPRWAIATLIVLSLAGGIAALSWFRKTSGPVETHALADVLVQRLTDGFGPLAATVSRDGNYLVYHEIDGETATVYVQQVGQTSRIAVLSSRDVIFGTKTFSPDGKFINYVTHPKSNKSTELLRIPTMGGPSIKLLENIDGGISFAPDGERFVFRRSKGTETSLVVADRNGKSERTLVQRSNPFELMRTPAWSPDGTMIVFGQCDLRTSREGGNCRLLKADAVTGATSELGRERWDSIFRSMWLPDGSGVVLVGTRENDVYSTRRDQVYFVSFPSGVSRRIITDGNRYDDDSIGVTNDGGVFAVQFNRSSQIWLMDARGESKNARQITRGTADGRAGLCSLDDAGIGFLARTADEVIMKVAGADGNNGREIVTGFPFIEEIRCDPNGNFMVFSGVSEKRTHLFRVDLNDGAPKQLTFGDSGEIDSTISPDGKTIIYESISYLDDKMQSTLFRIPSDGGSAEVLVKGCALPNFSPDGLMVSCVRIDSMTIEILSAIDGAKIESFPLPAAATWNFGLVWTPDGSGLVYIYTENGVSNLWIQPRGQGGPSRLTNFTSGTIFRFAFTRDGSKLLVARGYPIRDAIALRNFK